MTTDNSSEAHLPRDPELALDALYAPPASRPASGGVVQPTGKPLWVGLGLGWAAIGFTYLWVGVAFPAAVRFTSLHAEWVGYAWLGMLVLPTLVLGGYFALRRQWKSLLGVALAWACVLVLIVLFVSAVVALDGGMS